MSNQLAVIEDKINSKDTMRTLMLALGAESSQDATAANNARRYISSVLAEVRKSAGAEYGDLTVCSPDSIVQSMIDAAKFRVEIDGRKLAHMEVRYNKKRQCNEATLMIDTNGFVAKIAEAFPNVDYSTSTVFEGDTLEIIEKDGNKDYSLVRKDPFCSDTDKLRGIVVKIAYTDNTGRFIQHVDTVSKADLLAMKAMAKGTAWKNWEIERMRTAALKRCCKWHFRKISMLHDMIEFDNKTNYDVNAAPSVAPSAGTVIDNLNNAMAKEKPQTKVVDAEFSDEDTPPAEVTCEDCKGEGRVPWKVGADEGIEPCKPCGGTGKRKPTPKTDETPPAAGEGKAA